MCEKYHNFNNFIDKKVKMKYSKYLFKNNIELN